MPILDRFALHIDDDLHAKKLDIVALYKKLRDSAPLEASNEKSRLQKKKSINPCLDLSGVYVFFKRTHDGVIYYYVGESYNVKGRMRGHFGRHGKQRGLWYYLMLRYNDAELASEELDSLLIQVIEIDDVPCRLALEAYCVGKMRPIYSDLYRKRSEVDDSEQR